MTLVDQKEALSVIVSIYDDLNLLTWRIRKKVEAQLRRFRMGSVPWSPEIQQLMDTRKLWTNIVKLKKGVKISKKKIRRQLKRLGLSTSVLKGTLLEAQQQANQVRREWLAAVKQAPDLRKSWLESLAQARAAENGTTAEKELKQLRHREKQQEESRRRRAISGKGADKAKTTKMNYSVLDPTTGEVTSKVECNCTMLKASVSID
jgi:hypothetical protein